MWPLLVYIRQTRPDSGFSNIYSEILQINIYNTRDIEEDINYSRNYMQTTLVTTNKQRTHLNLTRTGPRTHTHNVQRSSTWECLLAFHAFCPTSTTVALQNVAWNWPLCTCKHTTHWAQYNFKTSTLSWIWQPCGLLSRVRDTCRQDTS
jgi:hypothetical protein